ncbi:molybdopterin-dependent oxidoreductase [Halomonas salifodinae]|uniref:Molybdopterin-dependent oxidoreductase n=1 Tax=Halomonas salifodinae TaxID=438745 RepID=A0ABW2ER50_9GAMM
MKNLAIVWLCLGLLGIAPALANAPLPTPQGPVLLRISGEIAKANSEGEAHFDRQMLQSLPQHQRCTTTPWTDGRIRYQGPLMRDLLAWVGAPIDGSMLATALDGFRAEIPLSDLVHHDVMLAIQQEGQPLAMRDLGPLFVLYPFDEKPELLNELIRFRSVWHLAGLHIHALEGRQ